MRLYILQFIKNSMMGESHDPKYLTLHFPLEKMIKYSQIQDAWTFHRALMILIMRNHFIALWPCSKKSFKERPPKPVLGELAMIFQVSPPK